MSAGSLVPEKRPLGAELSQRQSGWGWSRRALEVALLCLIFIRGGRSVLEAFFYRVVIGSGLRFQKTALMYYYMVVFL